MRDELFGVVVKELELANSDGEGYIPPGLYIEEVKQEENLETGENQDLEVIGIGRIEKIVDENGETKIIGWYDGKPVDAMQLNGAFVLGKEYEDSEGTTYNYGVDENGKYYYEYTTPAGETYKQELEGTPQSPFEKGNEKQTITQEDENGNKISVEISSTGYEIKDKGGREIVKEAYDEGKYAFVGGGKVQVDAFGVTVENKKSEATVWSYNPELKNYYDPTSGVAFTTDVSPHDTSYAGDGKYQYTHGGSNYFYNAEKKSWTLPDGKEIAANVAPAPIGAESQGKYETASGKTWKYETGTWKAYDDKGNVKESYTPSPNNYYHYEEGKGYIDTEGNLHGSESVAAPDGKSWTRNTDGSWTSDSGEKYNPSTGAFEGGGSEKSSGEQYGHHYSYDASGKVVSDTNSQYGGGYYTESPSGGYGYFNPEYEVGASGVATQKDSQGNTWTQD